MYDTDAADAGNIAGIRDTDALNLHSILQPLSLPRVAHLLEPLQHPLQAPKVWSHTKMERGNHGRPIHSQGGNDLMVNKDSICSRGICSLI